MTKQRSGINARLLGLGLILILLISAYATPLSASEAFMLQLQPELPSAWAAVDVFMAESAYELGDELTYSAYQAALTELQFMPVLADLAEMSEALGLAETSDDPIAIIVTDGFVTRGAVLSALCETMGGDPGAGAEDAAVWFVERGLMSGRASGDYALDNPCTVEEMLVFAVRSYEYMVYEAGLDSRGFFWEVTGEGNSVYLLGSIHVSDGSMYPMSKAITTAFGSSDFLAVEADIFGITVFDTMTILQKGVIPAESGMTIKDYISAETYELYTLVFDAFGFEPDAFDYMKPWLAGMMLQNLNETYSEAEAELGVDMYFLRKAYAADLDIIELEGLAFQCDVFDSFSPELQEFQLLSALIGLIPEVIADDSGSISDESDMRNYARDSYLYLLDIVRTGDEEALSMVLALDAIPDDPLEIEYNEVFLVNRNKGMAEKISVFLSEGAIQGDYFVVVGAAHMLGDDGIVALLTDMGYSVERR